MVVGEVIVEGLGVSKWVDGGMGWRERKEKEKLKGLNSRRGLSERLWRYPKPTAAVGPICVFGRQSPKREGWPIAVLGLALAVKTCCPNRV